MAEKAGSVTMIVLSIVGFFAILSIVFQQHNIKIKNNNKRALVKREYERQEWFEFSSGDDVIALKRSSITSIQVGKSETLVRWSGGGSGSFSNNQAKELLRFAGLPHLIKEDDGI